ITIGTAMIGATVFSAVGADLSSYPQPFVKSGVFNGEIVVGNDAKVADVVGAIDIAASLQYAMKVAGMSGSASSEGGVITVETSDATVEGGVLIVDSGNDFNLGDTLSGVAPNGKLTDKELPDMLADGIVVDEDDTNTELDYEQTIEFQADALAFSRGSDIGNEDVPSLYIGTNSGSTYDVVINLKDAMNFSKMADSEKMTLLGKEYTIKPNQAATASELILLGSDNTVLLNLGESKTIAGVEYTLVGANGDNNNAILKVGSSQKTVVDGTTYTIGGQEVYVKSLYITTIPTTSASVELMVGSQELKLKTGSQSSVKVNDVTVKGVTANVTGGVGAASEIRFRVTPSDVSDANKYLEMGTEFVDPIFGFKLAFTGSSEELDAASKSKVSLERSGDNVVLTFTNDEGDEYSLDVYTWNSTNNVAFAENFVASGSTITGDDKEFVLGDSTGKKTYAYKIVDFDEDIDNNKNTSTIKDLSTGKEYTIEAADYVGDSNVTVSGISYSGKTIALGGTLLSSFKIENEGVVALDVPRNTTGGVNGAFVNATVTFTEGNKAEETEVQAFDDKAVTVLLADTDSGSTSENLGISGVTTTMSTTATDKDGNVGYVLSVFGTYAEWDKENGNTFDLYYPKDTEVKYFVSVAAGESTSAQATKEYSEGDVLKGIGTIKAITAGSVTGGSYNINKIALPLAKLDIDTTLGSTNQIIVGGPAVNRLAAEAVGVTYPAYGLSSGLLQGAGEAVIKLVEQGSKVAIVVAGWEAEDTQRATTVLANYANYATKLTGAEVKVTGTISSPVISLVVEEVAEAVAEEEVVAE
ncbi:MAG: hypothetical protein WC254_06330, partial [Candidatus Woesearchaeota archaeon]